MPYTYNDIPEPPSLQKLVIAFVIIVILAILFTRCSSPLHAYRPTDRYAFDSSFRYYRWIGPDERGGKWVRIKQWPKIVKR